MGKIRKFVVRVGRILPFILRIPIGRASCDLWKPYEHGSFFGCSKNPRYLHGLPQASGTQKGELQRESPRWVLSLKVIGHGSNASFPFTWSTSFLSTQVPPHLFPVGNPQDERKTQLLHGGNGSKGTTFFFWILTLYDNDNTTARNTPQIGWCTKTDPAKTCFSWCLSFSPQGSPCNLPPRRLHGIPWLWPEDLPEVRGGPGTPSPGLAGPVQRRAAEGHRWSAGLAEVHWSRGGVRVLLGFWSWKVILGVKIERFRRCLGS